VKTHSELEAKRGPHLKIPHKTLESLLLSSRKPHTEIHKDSQEGEEEEQAMKQQKIQIKMN